MGGSTSVSGQNLRSEAPQQPVGHERSTFVGHITQPDDINGRIDGADARLAALLAGSPVGTCICDPLANVQYCNDALLALLGRARSEIIGRSLSSWITDPSEAQLTRFIADLPQIDGRLDGAVRRADGEIRDVRISATVIAEGPRPEITFFFEERAIDARLYEAARRELAARDRCLGIVSHDLRSPLSTAMSALRLLGAGDTLAGAESVRENLEMAERAVLRGLRIVDDLLDIRRCENGTFSILPTEFDLAEFLSEVAAVHRPQIEKGSKTLHVRVHSSAAGSIVADADRLHQAFDNLISNALKNTSAGGMIRISAVASTAGVVITVTDSGTGLTDEQIANMLEWGWQAEGKDSRGFGIGMAVVGMIVAAHGGRVWAERRPAAGLSVHVSLPWGSATTGPGTGFWERPIQP